MVVGSGHREGAKLVFSFSTQRANVGGEKYEQQLIYYSINWQGH